MTDLDELKRRLERAKRDMRWCLISESAPRINAMLDLARSEDGIPAVPDELDRDPWLLNVQNGTLDLRTGRLREHRREDLLTKVCPTRYDARAGCPLWGRFLDAVFEGDEELVRFLQRLFGYCLTGEASEQILPIFWGSGANGKTTLINAVTGAIGPDYAGEAVPDLLLVPKGERHLTELAFLFGRRLVVCSEADQGGRLNEARVKRLTGSDKITARRMREDPWEFTPTHKLILLTNHRPTVKGNDHALWRRLRLVPFTVTFWDPDDPTTHGRDLPADLRQDKRLGEKLSAEAPGILAWMVRGCLDWQRGGLTLPAKVQAATRQYRDAEDLLGQFLAECCVAGDKDFRCRSRDLYGAYVKWAEGNGEEALSGKAFGDAMTAKGFGRDHSNGTWYLRVALRDASGD
jgi:putative DNA primase/helicase